MALAALLSVSIPAHATSLSSVSRVVVYSNHARVFREARVKLAGARARVPVASLPAAVLPGSVQVACPTARISRVELVRSYRRLPRQEVAHKAANELERLLGQRRLLQAERRTLDAEVRFIRTLKLRPGDGREKAPAPAISVDTWRAILRWQQARIAAAHKRLAELAAGSDLLDRKIHAVQVKVKDQGLTSGGGQATRVVVSLAGGAGQHRLTLSYLVRNAGWRPSYDLRYDAARGRLQASYHALVHQRTGEDWKAARLAFSTGQPSRVLQVPRLATWTIGRRRDFSPGPTVRTEPAQKFWQPTSSSLAALGSEVDRLKRTVMRSKARFSMMRDMRRLENKRKATERSRGEQARLSYFKNVTKLGPAGKEARLQHYVAKLRQVHQIARNAAKQARRDKDIIKLNCVNDKLILIVGNLKVVEIKQRRLAQSRREGDLKGMDHALVAATVAYQKGIVLEQEAEACLGEEMAYVGSTRVETEVDPDVHSLKVRKPPPVVRRVPWIDTVYVPPAVERNSPAGAARGYLFTLRAPGRHNVPSSVTWVRVPLLRVALAVRPVHRLLPGLSKSAYVVATVRNTTGRPILRGNAFLFTGTSWVGHSWLNTALPGGELRLPLGVDDNVKVARNMRQKTVEKGVLFKDDVTRYTVELQVANHHRRPITVELLDQVPLATGKKVEVKGLRYLVAGRPRKARPPSKTPGGGWTAPDEQGRVRWRGQIAASSVKKLAFSFVVVRPRGRVLSQSEGGAR